MDTNTTDTSRPREQNTLFLTALLCVACFPCVICFLALIAHMAGWVGFQIECCIKRRVRSQGVSLGFIDVRELNKKNKHLQKNTECSVCLENATSNSVVLGCGHRFHTRCVNQWIEVQMSDTPHPTCPLCRSPIIQRQPAMIESDSESDSDSNDYY